MARRKIFVINPNGEPATAPRDNALIVKTHPHGSQSRFNSRGIVVIANQRIRHPKSVRIERPADRNSRLPETRASEVLDRSQESSRTNNNAHADNFSNS